MAPTPVTLDRVAAWFEEFELNYQRQEELVVTGFPGLGVSIFFEGDDDIWLRVLGHWMGQIPPSETPAVADFTSQWNADKVVPKVTYGETTYEGVDEVTVSGEIVALVEAGFTDDQLKGFLDMALSALNFWAESVAEAFPAYAPDDSEDN